MSKSSHFDLIKLMESGVNGDIGVAAVLLAAAADFIQGEDIVIIQLMAEERAQDLRPSQLVAILTVVQVTKVKSNWTSKPSHITICTEL